MVTGFTVKEKFGSPYGVPFGTALRYRTAGFPWLESRLIVHRHTLYGLCGGMDGTGASKR